MGILAYQIGDGGGRQGFSRSARIASQNAVGIPVVNFVVLIEQSRQLDTVVNASIRGTQIALAEFEAGTVDYTTVAAAQETQLSNQLNALTVEESRLITAVTLIGDLGGGWSDSQLK